ncbi:MAG: carbon-nitrogen family hydrolase [Deltaproteobacteria bacterium]|nr:carbon-nitrogen family hydrolase [Deltaproteobacteria bacterium]
MKVAAAQMDIAWHDRNANHDTIRRLAADAREREADLLVFPEMAVTGFSMDTSITAEPIDGPTPSLFRNLAKTLDMAIVGGFVLERKGGRPQNVALAVDRKGEDLALYAKTHQIGLLDEDQHYDPGDRSVSFQLGDMEVACVICYDLRFPELFRSLADTCGLILVIASWPSVRQRHWDILLPARAVENQLYVVGVNRVGDGGGHFFTGGSAIIDPAGEVVARGGDRETLMVGDIEPKRVQEVRSAMPFLKDRKPHLFYEKSD